MSDPGVTTGSHQQRPSPWWLWDGSVVLGVAVVQVVLTTVAAQGQDDRLPLDPLGYALLLTGPVLLWPRRRWPLVSLVLVLGVTATYYGLGYPFGPAFLSALVALSGTVLDGRRLAAGALGSLGLAAYFTLDHVVSGRTPSLASLAGHLAWLLVVLAGAEVVRMQRRRQEDERRARAESERRRASEQRLRVARELHDVLGHSISLINVQAGVALHLLDRDPEQARAALRAIKEASRGTLEEVRSALDMLRTDGDGAPRDAPPGLARLDDLVSQCAQAGLRVSVTSRGEPRPLGPSLDLAAYRIVQEALTNVVRHSGADAAEVSLDHGPGALTVTVSDQGGGVPSLAPVRTGTGIAGMRERAAAVGGTLAAGPGTDGGFRVTATLPVPDGERTP